MNKDEIKEVLLELPDEIKDSLQALEDDATLVALEPALDDIGEAVEHYLNKNKLDIAAGLIEAKLILCSIGSISLNELFTDVYMLGYQKGKEND